MVSRVILAVLVLVTAGMAGCSGGAKTVHKADYAQAKTLPPLEVPPDLVAPAGDDAYAVPASEEAAADRTVLPRRADVRILGSGKERWAQVDATPAETWNHVREFWLESGFELTRQEPVIGIMETQWAENRANIPEGGLRGLLGGIFEGLYAAPNRDRFRARLERTEDGRTEVFITHYGMEQVVTGSSTESEVAKWRNRPADPELVNEMLNRLVVFLGTDPAEATPAPTAVEAARPRAEFVGETTLLVRANFARTWRRTGLALDRLGLLVEDRNRSEGLYYTRWSGGEGTEADGDEGFFSSLFSGGDEAPASQQRVQLRLTAANDEETEITALGSDGEPLASAQARAVLTLLEQQLR